MLYVNNINRPDYIIRVTKSVNVEVYRLYLAFSILFTSKFICNRNNQIITTYCLYVQVCEPDEDVKRK